MGKIQLTKNLSGYFQGDYIWIEPATGREFDVAIGARVVSAEGRRIQVRDDDGEEQWLTPERRIKAMHASSVDGVEDMISLGDLHEAGILRNLLIRYNLNLIYVSWPQISTFYHHLLTTFYYTCCTDIYGIDFGRCQSLSNIAHLHRRPN